MGELYMRLVIQCVQNASVIIEQECVGKIGRGMVVFVGVGQGDNREITEKLFHKMIKLRIFEDQNGKTNLSLRDIQGELLIISQFTLYADCRKGNRPSFVKAAEPETANQLYEYFLELAQAELPDKTAHGKFGADMKVSLINDGPFTILLDSEELL